METQVTNATEYRDVSLSLLNVSKTNPRRTFDETSLKELAESIRAQGVLSPLLVRPLTENGFEIVFGERRYRAAQLAAQDTVPVRIKQMSDAEALESQLVENLIRAEIHPMEEAQGFRALLDLEEPKYSIEQIAAKVGKTPAFIAQRLKLSDLAPASVEAFYADEIGVGHALLLAKLPADQQEQALSACFKEVYSGATKPARILLPVRNLQFWIDSNILLNLKDGQYISRKIAAAEWGDGVVLQLAAYIARTQPGTRGFTTSNLFRMKKFYETYRDEPIGAPLAHQLPWSHNLIILGQSKRLEEREFYLRMAVQERWTKRELERQFKAALFERVVLSPVKVAPLVHQMYPEAESIFKDSYTVEFLGLPQTHTEHDLHRALLNRMKEFLLELGRDFCFVGSEFPVQVGGRDFALDLLFFHRGLNALVAFELKVNEFEPEYLGKLNFYLEALDRDMRKAHEQPSIGVLLCASKNDEVVEYALSRSLSPALIAEYQTKLPDKKLLQAKLHEFYLQNAGEGEEA
jgi:ParB/RepB/Spo0J family partition protein